MCPPTARGFANNAAVFAGPFYRTVFPLAITSVLVLFPTVAGMRYAARRRQEGRA